MLIDVGLVVSLFQSPISVGSDIGHVLSLGLFSGAGLSQAPYYVVAVIVVVIGA